MEINDRAISQILDNQYAIMAHLTGNIHTVSSIENEMSNTVKVLSLLRYK